MIITITMLLFALLVSVAFNVVTIHRSRVMPIRQRQLRDVMMRTVRARRTIYSIQDELRNSHGLDIVGEDMRHRIQVQIDRFSEQEFEIESQESGK